MKWEDDTVSVDYDRQALTIAKRFVRKNPWEDRGAVYSAAQEAAYMYEISQALSNKFTFEIWCYLRIKTVLYISKRRSKKTKGHEAKEVQS